MRLFSIGHGDRTLDEFLATLRSGAVTHVVDVRSFPGSRRHPQFGREVLAASLATQEIGYRWEPRLGGRRRRGPEPSLNPSWQVEAFRNYADYLDSPVFSAGLASLLEQAAAAPTAFMCAERHFSQCHRRIISDKLWALRHEVVHLLSPQRQQLHHPPPFLRIDGAQLRYDQ